MPRIVIEKPKPPCDRAVSAKVTIYSSTDRTPSETDAPAHGDLITVARIARPQGLKGEVLAQIVTDFPDRFAQLSTVFICAQAEPAREVPLEKFWFHQGCVVLKFHGIDTRTEAEGLRNAAVQIRAADLVALPSDSYYEFQLIGCEVSTEAGEALGQVKEVIRTGAAPILVIAARNGAEHLIPFAEEICHKIDIQAKKITVAVPEGLLDL